MTAHRFQAQMPVEVVVGLLGLPDDTTLLDVAIVHRTGQLFIVGDSPTVQADEVVPGADAPVARRSSETVTCHGRLISHTESWST